MAGIQGWPIEFEAVELPADYKPSAGTKVAWPTKDGLLVRDSNGKDQLFIPAERQQTVGSVNAPNLDDPNWGFWFQYFYNYASPTPSAYAEGWIRVLPENDKFPLGVFDLPAPKLPTAADSVPSATLAIARDIALPQWVSFRYIPGRGDIPNVSSIVSFPKNTFSGISYELLDGAQVVINGTGKGQIITANDTGVGLSFPSVPAAARFARFIFQYRVGGNVPYVYPIT